MRLCPRLKVAILILALIGFSFGIPGYAEGPARGILPLEEYAIRINEAEVALRRDPRALRPHFELGEAYYHTGNQAAARHHLEIFLKQAPSGPDSIHAAHLNARVLLAKGMRLRATRALIQLADRPGVPADAWHDLSLLFRSDRFPVKAIMAEMRAIELSGGSTVYRREAARQWKELSRPDQAVEQYLLLIEPGAVVEAEDHFQLGYLAHRLGFADLAVQGYEEALRIDPVHPEAHYNLSILRSRAGEVDRAVYHLEQVLRIKPKYEQAYFELGRLFLAHQRGVEAESVFRRLLVFGSDSLALAEAQELIHVLEEERSR